MAFNPPSLATKYLNRRNGRMGPPPGAGLRGSISPPQKKRKFIINGTGKELGLLGKILSFSFLLRIRPL
jgi:hypothetical protein